MAATTEALVKVFHDGVLYDLARTNEHSFSSFGGPLEVKVNGCEFGPHRLHRIAKVSSHQIPALGPPLYVWDVPLIYGMRYSGCLIKYRFAIGEIQVEDIVPRNSEDDWPYFDYPNILPFAPLALGDTKKLTWREFAEAFPNMSEMQPKELVAVVEPPMTLGFSLWGESGDAEGVVIVFECDLKGKHVTSYNLCS